MHHRLRRVILLLLAGALPVEIRAAAAPTAALQITTATKSFSRGFRGELERVVAQHRGVMGLSLKNLDTGEQVDVNGNEMFPTASTIKLAVMCTVFDELSSPSGRFKSYYDTRTYDASTSVSGAGFVQRFTDGTKIELKELLHFMITVSDNTATNMLVEAVGGLQPVNDWLINHGFEKTRMFSTVFGKIVWDAEMRKVWGLGVTTPNEMRRLCEIIATGKAGTTTATDEMLRLLSHQYFDGGIPAEIPPSVWVGSKSGAINDSRSDNAIVSSPAGRYVLSIYTKDNVERSWGDKNEAEANIRAVSRIVFKHYNPKSKWSRPAGTEKL